MQEILTYAISSIALSGGFYSLFRALLQGERAFALNRRLLIGLVVLSLALPALSFTDLFKSPLYSIPAPIPKESVTSMVEKSVGATLERKVEKGRIEPGSFSLNETEPMTPLLRKTQAPEKEMDFGPFAIYFYFAISLNLIISLIKSLRRIRAISRGGIVSKFPGYSICVTGNNIAPFSFWKTIYIPYGVYSEEDSRQIILHERAHIEQRHSLDLIFLELVCALAWFNPVLRLFKKSAVELHEYLADSAALSAGVSRIDYASTLYKNLTGEKLFVPSHYLNKDQIKRRLKMMSKSSKKRLIKLKYALVLPAVVLLGLAFSCSQVKRDANTDVEGLHVALVPAMTNNAPGYGPAKYRGGVEALEARLLRNKTFREIADMSDNSLELTVEFEVNKEGRTEWPQYFGTSYDELRYKGKNWDLDEAISYFITRLPSFQPATFNGMPINTMMRLVINFSDLGVMPHYFPDRKEMPDRAAKFPGGYSAFQTYISQNIKMPGEAKKRGIIAKVNVKFNVEPDGSITEPEVISYKRADDSWNYGEDYGCKAEAVRLAAGMPKWKPAMKNGKAVRSIAVIPVMFGDEYTWETKNSDRVMIFPVIKNEEKMTRSEKDQFYKDNSIRTTMPDWRGNYFADQIQKNLIYPKTPSGFNKAIVIRTEFIVNSRGEITEPKIAGGYGPEFDAAALRAVKSLSPVKPALDKSGKPVEYKVFATVNFIH